MNLLGIFSRPTVHRTPPPGPAFLVLRTSTKRNVPINLDEAVQFGEGSNAIEQLLEWCREQKVPVTIHANGFDNGGDSTDYPCLEICDG